MVAFLVILGIIVILASFFIFCVWLTSRQMEEERSIMEQEEEKYIELKNNLKKRVLKSDRNLCDFLCGNCDNYFKTKNYMGPTRYKPKRKSFSIEYNYISICPRCEKYVYKFIEYTMD